MATGNLRSTEVLSSGLVSWLAETARGRGVPALADMRHATEGWANETLMVDVTWSDHEPESIVIRMPPVEPSFPDYDLAMQAAVQTSVAEAGVPAPAPVSYVEDVTWLGVPFMVMPLVAGRVPGQAPVFDPWVTKSSELLQRRLHDRFIETLGAIHNIDWRSDKLDYVLRGAEGSIEAELDRWDRYLVWAADGQPLAVLVDALAWCRAHRPPDSGRPNDTVLLWGDARMGNLIMSDDRDVLAVLDWELASLGAPEMDMAWYLVLDAVLEQLVGQRVKGFPDRNETIASYESIMGRNLENLWFHETFALTRALAINDRQARVAAVTGQEYIAGTGADNPMFDFLAARLG